MGVAMGSGTSAQGVAPAQNMTYEAFGASPNQVPGPPVTYAAPPSPPAPETVTGKEKVTETVTKVVAGVAPPAVIAIPHSPRDPKSANSHEFKTQVIDAVSHGEDVVTISTSMAVGLLEKGLEAESVDVKPLKITKARRTGGCCCPIEFKSVPR